jgi:adenine deaminase
VTINPAKQLGVENRVGSIEPGKDADLTIFDKHPLSNYAKVEKVFIDGDLYFDRQKDLEERPGKDARKKALLDKMKAEEKKDRRRPGPADDKKDDKKSDEPGGEQ